MELRSKEFEMRGRGARQARHSAPSGGGRSAGGHLEVWVSVRVEGERAVRVDVEEVLGRVLALRGQRVAHAVALLGPLG